MGEEAHAQPSIGLNPRSVPLDELPTNPLQQRLIVINFLVTALAFLFWALRIYSKHTAKQLGIDDWLMTAAMAFSIGLAPVTYLYFRYCYTGFPQASIPETRDMEQALFFNWMMQIFYNPILGLVKASALVFLHRLGGHSRRISLSIQGLGVLNLALMIAVFLTVIFQTTPINAYWDLTVERKRQIDGPAFYVTSAIITIVTDVLVLMIPFPLILGLNMRVATKIGILVVLLLGGVYVLYVEAISFKSNYQCSVTVVGIIRVYIFHRTFYDASYDASNSLNNCLSAVEVNLAIMAASGPAFRLLLGRVFPGLFTTHAGTSAEIPSGYGGAPKSMSRAVDTETFRLGKLSTNKHHSVVLGRSPNTSEEEIMTYNGIMRTTQVV
ncbi:hypothetical protein NM208_g4934 [Fusarium decemcellulare]|uniref:Uncharacterized protein n=1 Tax=Fusarium decemcellulare TaxID=57161 RepID=A0ACC1SJ05_9HYPO|nr:hypothetical protein NM208_g4934 [Fusarium decemcellulare]